MERALGYEIAPRTRDAAGSAHVGSFRPLSPRACVSGGRTVHARTGTVDLYVYPDARDKQHRSLDGVVLAPATGRRGTRTSTGQSASRPLRAMPTRESGAQPRFARFFVIGGALVSRGMPRAPRLEAAVDAANLGAEPDSRAPDDIDLLKALARQPDAVAGKALGVCDVGDGVARVNVPSLAVRSCVEVLQESEDFAAADGSLFLATEHVLCVLLQPGAAPWDLLAASGIDPRLVRGQAATEASEFGRPIETAEVRTRASGFATPWAQRATAGSAGEAASSTADRVAEGIATAEAVVGLAVVTHSRGHSDIAVRGTTEATAEAAMSADSLLRIGSLTKVLTALATLALVERNGVSLDVPVGEHLRSLRITPSPGPTLRHLLIHTGGAPVGAYLHTPGELAPSFVDIVQGVVALDATPGERWAYSNVGYAIVGQALEEVSGVPFDELLDDTVLKPLGMVSTTVAPQATEDLPTGYWIDNGDVVAVPKRDIILRPAGGAVSTPFDIALLVQFLATPSAAAAPPISERAVKSMFVSQAPHIGPAATAAGLAFRLRSIDGRPVGWHPGRISGFPCAMYVSVASGSAVITNTESLAVSPAASSALADLMRPDDP